MKIDKVVKHIKFLKQVAVETPYFYWIIVITILSGFMKVFGLPMLIPILDYMGKGEASLSDPIMKTIMDIFAVLGINQTFLSLLLIACTLILLSEFLTSIGSVLSSYSSFTLGRNFSKKLLDLYTKTNWLWLTGVSSGEINYVIMKEAHSAALCNLYAQRFIIYFIQCAAYLYLAFYISWQSVLFAFFIFIILFFLNFKNAFYIRRISRDVNDTSKKTANLLAAFQRNKKFLKTSLLNKQVVLKLFSDLDEICVKNKHSTLRYELQRSWNFSFMFAFLFVLIIFHRQINVPYSSLLVLILVFQQLYPQFDAMAGAYSAVNISLPMYISVKERLQDAHNNQERLGGTPYQSRGDIDFRNVNFSYPNGQKVFEDLNFKIKPLHTVAFVGKSGVGKTTILDMILGLLSPTSGEIFYGPISQKDIDLVSLRNKIAYVSQEPTLMDGTLKQNLTMAFPGADENMVNEIIRKVHMEQFINRLSDGLNTFIGENGVKLSGGQKQRVVIGRSLFMKPEILILDEATSELDSESEQAIQQTLQELKKEMTIIIVAHRLSTVKLADTIYVMENGKISESGSYEALIQKKGVFYYLNSLQN